MELFFLEAADGSPLTKTIEIDKQGWITKHPYPHIHRFNSYRHELPQTDAIRAFQTLMQAHADRGHCLIKGRLNRTLSGESRAGSTRTEDETQWICIDIDRPKDFTSLSQFVSEALPPVLQDVSYIAQYSSSHGLTDDLSAHLFFLLDQPVAAPMLKSWLQWINLQDPLADQLSLSVNGATLKYPVDVTTCQNDKLLYIAPPVIRDARPEPVELPPRIKTVHRERERVPLRIDPAQVAEAEDLALERVKALRKKLGLKVKTPKFKTLQGIQVMTNASRAYVTGPLKKERGFTYMNINGGDSYAYWHPDDNPTFIHNFKGEPIYLTQTFLPDYWEQLAQSGDKSAVREPLVFRDFKSDTYWNGIHDPSVPSLVMARTSGKDKLNDFMTQHGAMMPDPIPDWDYRFDPHSNVLVDKKKRFANMWVPSVYMRNVPPKQEQLPPTVERILRHVTADEESYLTLVHWLAWVYQKRTKTGTAFVLHGVEGTGKGILFHHILSPTLGPEYCRIVTVQDFKDSFNEWMERCLILFVDEVKLDGISDRKTINQLKNLITEPTGRIRAMRTNAYQVDLFFNMIFASNDQDALYISESDRRLHVAERQESRLFITTEEIEAIETELTHFLGFIMHMEIDEQRVQMTADTEAKANMRLAAQNSVDHFFNAFHNADLAFFLDYGSSQPPFDKQLEFDQCKTVLEAWKYDAEHGQPSKVSRDALYRVYHYIQGGKPLSPSQFGRMLSHHNIRLRNMRDGDAIIRGTTVNWNLPDHEDEDNVPDPKIREIHHD